MQYPSRLLLLAPLLVAGCVPGHLVGPIGSDGGPPDEPDAGSLDGATSNPPPRPDAASLRPDAGADAGSTPTIDAGPERAITNVPTDLDVALYLVIGDSIAAGRNAHDGIRRGGYGYARLMHENQRDWEGYRGRDLGTLFGARFAEVATSGDQSGEALSDLRRALASSLPARVDGDVVVSISVGGNDFDDNWQTIVDASRTAAVTAEVRRNLAEMFALLRDRYAVGGHRVVLLVHDVHDPTGGTGRIPPGVYTGRCRYLASALVLPSLREAALANIATLNAGIAAEVLAQDATLVPMRDTFLDHGMNVSGAERWLSADCVHPSDRGHHEIRALEWNLLFGERL